MCNVTHTRSSPLADASYSKQAAEHVIRDLRDKASNATLTVRDLAQLLHTLLPPAQADRIAAVLRRLQAMSPAEKQALLRQRSVP